ncbi:MAG: GPW/gp25 family protein [Xenococcaceae cyanobacterium]
MNQARYRAWCFLHPDWQVEAELSGFCLSPQGSISMVAEETSVRQAILLLLSTRPGERVMHPDYGCRLHQLVFSPNDETTAGLAIYYVQQALELWEPRIQIIRLDANRHATDLNKLEIILEYQVRGSQHQETLGFAINLAGD